VPCINLYSTNDNIRLSSTTTLTAPALALQCTRPTPHCTTLALHHTHPAPRWPCTTHTLHPTHCTTPTAPCSLHHPRCITLALHRTRLHHMRPAPYCTTLACNTAAFIAAFTSALYQHSKCSASYDIRQAATCMAVVFKAAAGMPAVHVGMASVVMAAAGIHISSGLQHCLPHLRFTHMHTHEPGYTQGM
jgi:hypothetical protein